jgi:hypothetical protein
MARDNRNTLYPPCMPTINGRLDSFVDNGCGMYDMPVKLAPFSNFIVQHLNFEAGLVTKFSFNDSRSLFMVPSEARLSRFCIGLV